MSKFENMMLNAANVICLLLLAVFTISCGGIQCEIECRKLAVCDPASPTITLSDNNKRDCDWICISPPLPQRDAFAECVHDAAANAATCDAILAANCVSELP